MSAKLMGQVWDLDIPHGEAWVLMAICDHADHDGNNAFPGLDLLQYKTGYSERQLRRHLDSLEQKQILIKTGGGIGRGQVQVYSVRLEKAPVKKRSKWPVKQVEKADILSEKADILSPEKRTFEAQKADISGTLYKEEPLITVHEPSESTPALIFDEIFPGKRTIHITDAIDQSSISDEKVWRAALERWRMNGYSLRNIAGLIDSYKTSMEQSDGRTEYQRKVDEFTRSTREAFAAQEAARERNRANRPPERPVVYITPPTLADKLAAEKRRRDAESGVGVV